MDNITNFSLITAAISTIKPVFIDAIKIFWLSKIKNDQKRKISIQLLSLTIGIILSLIINHFGEFGINTIDCILIGTGISYSSENIAYRTRKAFNKKG